MLPLLKPNLDRANTLCKEMRFLRRFHTKTFSWNSVSFSPEKKQKRTAGRAKTSLTETQHSSWVWKQTKGARKTARLCPAQDQSMSVSYIWPENVICFLWDVRSGPSVYRRFSAMLWRIVMFRRDHVKGVDEREEHRRLVTHVMSVVAVERIILVMSGLFEATL